MGQLTYYRYCDDGEAELIRKNRRIEPSPGSGVKYYTTDRYDRASDAQRWLALGYLPTVRVGPLRPDEMPDFDRVPLQVASPKNGQPGGGTEAATAQTLYLFEMSRLI